MIENRCACAAERDWYKNESSRKARRKTGGIGPWHVGVALAETAAKSVHNHQKPLTGTTTGSAILFAIAVVYARDVRCVTRLNLGRHTMCHSFVDIWHE
jgi:hypothetical protein